MASLITKIFTHNWQRKCAALLMALIIWLFVNHSIIETKTIPHIPIRIINLPPGKTAIGLLSNGTLGKRITLTLTGTKDVVESLEPGDLEVQLHATEIHHNEWVLHLTKKNLISLNPSINLANHITYVDHNEYILRLGKLVTEKIPIHITTVGEAPPGYEFLDIWPEMLMQTVTGPDKEVRELKAEGIEASINLNDISKFDLDKLQKSQTSSHNDEIAFSIPNKWKSVTIPYYKNPITKDFNDPEAENLRLDFLREELLELERNVPIRVFYPLNHIETINPQTYPIAINDDIETQENLSYLTTPLYARNVSKLFLDLIRDHIEIAIVAAPKEERQILQWSLQIIDPNKLEDTYVAYWLANLAKEKSDALPPSKRNETLLRARFRDYMQKLVLYTSPDTKFNLESLLDNHHVKVKVDK